MFEQATREKLRFPFRGMISVEDLWDLDLRDLDEVYKALMQDKNQYEEESLLDHRTSADKTLDLQIDVVTHVFTTKRNEAIESERAVEKAMEKQKLLAIIASKEEAELHALDVEALQQRIAELG